MQTYEVTIQPDGVRITVEAGCTILEAAQKAGIIINSACGGAGTCDKCLVEPAGSTKPVRSCQYRIDHDLLVTIPERSRFFEQKILQEGISPRSLLDPSVSKHFVQIAPPSLEDMRSDAQRLTETLKTTATSEGATGRDWKVDFSVLQSLPETLRDNDFAVTALCHNNRIFGLEAGDTRKVIFGLAVDVGTTTVVASLVDLTNGKTIAAASQTNPQVSFGDDVIGRIEYSRTQPDGLKQLQKKIIDCINQLIDELCEKSHISHQHIYEITIVGNSTMQQLLMGIPVEQIAQAPYVSTVTTAVNLAAARLGINIHPGGNVYIMPAIAAHVGGDTVAVALATAMRHSEKINLAIDIGTNGELVLGNQQQLTACSTAAGPAFEGARIRDGMRGARGAIEMVHIREDVELSVIGGGKPVGICGSGLIDIVAELLNVGIIDSSGRMSSADDLPDDLPIKLRERITQIDNNVGFILAKAEQTSHKKPIVITQRDVREVQLAKGAIHAGIMVLLRQRGIELTDVDRLYLAGAFGNYIRPESARRIGLLPDIPLEKIQFVGNAAGTGAIEVLLSREARNHAQSLAGQIEYIELAGRSEFQDIFTESMFFPDK